LSGTGEEDIRNFVDGIQVVHGIQVVDGGIQEEMVVDDNSQEMVAVGILKVVVVGGAQEMVVVVDGIQEVVESAAQVVASEAQVKEKGVASVA